MNRTLSIILAFTLLFVAFIIPVNANSNEVVTPRYIPIISHTTCTFCNSTMDYVGEYSAYREVRVDSCPNAFVSHDHNFRDIYNCYQCQNCGNAGRIYKKTTMQCEIVLNPYSIH